MFNFASVGVECVRATSIAVNKLAGILVIFYSVFWRISVQMAYRDNSVLKRVLHSFERIEKSGRAWR
jgi:hypothetical protein